MIQQATLLLKEVLNLDWNMTTTAALMLSILLSILVVVVSSMRVTSPMTMNMATLPPNVVKYSQVPSGKSRPCFTQDSIPKGLLRQHNTKQGTWGVIHIQRGKLRYTIDEGAHKGIYNLNDTTSGIIEPQVYHSVAPIDHEEVEFVVEFYRLPNTGPVHEEREGL